MTPSSKSAALLTVRLSLLWLLLAPCCCERAAALSPTDSESVSDGGEEAEYGGEYQGDAARSDASQPRLEYGASASETLLSLSSSSSESAASASQSASSAGRDRSRRVGSSGGHMGPHVPSVSKTSPSASNATDEGGRRGAENNSSAQKNMTFSDSSSSSSSNSSSNKPRDRAGRKPKKQGPAGVPHVPFDPKHPHHPGAPSENPMGGTPAALDTDPSSTSSSSAPNDSSPDNNDSSSQPDGSEAGTGTGAANSPGAVRMDSSADADGSMSALYFGVFWYVFMVSMFVGVALLRHRCATCTVFGFEIGAFLFHGKRSRKQKSGSSSSLVSSTSSPRPSSMLTARKAVSKNALAALVAGSGTGGGGGGGGGEDTQIEIEMQSFRAQPLVELPRLFGHTNTSILSREKIQKLVPHLPMRLRTKGWRMVYSSFNDGLLLSTLYRRVANKGPAVLAVRDSGGYVFGGFLSHSISPNKMYYGNGETFVYSMSPEFRVFTWAGKNRFFILSQSDCFALGGGDHFALWLDADISKGSSQVSATFSNRPLASALEFQVYGLEIWTFCEAF